MTIKNKVVGSVSEVSQYDSGGNITGMTLDNLDVGNANIGNANIQNAIIASNDLTIDVSNLHINGGSNGQFLRTNGAGNLSWVSGGAVAGGSNTQVQFNNASVLTGSANFTFDGSNVTLGDGTNATHALNLASGSNSFFIQSAANANSYVAVDPTAVSIKNLVLVNSRANLGNAANVIIGGGLNGYFLQTDGTGNLSWVAGGGGGGNGSPGGSNSQLQFNNAGLFGGITGVTSNGVGLTVSNANISITGGNSGQFLSTDGAGNLSFTSAAVASGSNGAVQYALNGVISSSPNFRYDVDSNSVNMPYTISNVQIANTLTILDTLNIQDATLNVRGSAFFNTGLQVGTQVSSSQSFISIFGANGTYMGTFYGYNPENAQWFVGRGDAATGNSFVIFDYSRSGDPTAIRINRAVGTTTSNVTINGQVAVNGQLSATSFGAINTSTVNATKVTSNNIGATATYSLTSTASYSQLSPLSVTALGWDTLSDSYNVSALELTRSFANLSFVYSGTGTATYQLSWNFMATNNNQVPGPYSFWGAKNGDSLTAPTNTRDYRWRGLCVGTPTQGGAFTTAGGSCVITLQNGEFMAVVGYNSNSGGNVVLGQGSYLQITRIA